MILQLSAFKFVYQTVHLAKNTTTVKFFFIQYLHLVVSNRIIPTTQMLLSLMLLNTHVSTQGKIFSKFLTGLKITKYCVNSYSQG